MRLRGVEPPRPVRATRPSTLRVYQFRHSRLRGVDDSRRGREAQRGGGDGSAQNTGCNRLRRALLSERVFARVTTSAAEAAD